MDVGDGLRIEHVPVGDEHLEVVRLDRPRTRNALDTALVAGLVDVLDAARGTAGLRGVVITGGEQVFSAGADLQERHDDGGRRRMELLTTLFETLLSVPVPTVAAIEGPAVGGGAELAAACDVRIAGAGAWLRFAGAIHGVPVGWARTIGQVGLSVAKDWVLSSREVAAEEAERRGFVQQVAPAGGAQQAALAWLADVAERDPGTVTLMKRWFDDHTGLADRVAFENDALRVQVESGSLPAADARGPRSDRQRR